MIVGLTTLITRSLFPLLFGSVSFICQASTRTLQYIITSMSFFAKFKRSNGGIEMIRSRSDAVIDINNINNTTTYNNTNNTNNTNNNTPTIRLRGSSSLEDLSSSPRPKVGRRRSKSVFTSILHL